LAGDRFQGKLGESRTLPGQDGPPGADYNTIPALKPKAVALVAFYRRKNDMEFIELLKKWGHSAFPLTLTMFFLSGHKFPDGVLQRSLNYRARG
jgi:hypothetical protein